MARPTALHRYVCGPQRFIGFLMVADPSAPTGSVGPRGVRAGVLSSTGKAVADGHPPTQRLADRAREQVRFVPRWRGLRVVATDASTLPFGLRASHVKRAAIACQSLFGLFLPGPDLMLAAPLHSVHERDERQFLFEHLDRLSPLYRDVLQTEAPTQLQQ